MTYLYHVSKYPCCTGEVNSKKVLRILTPFVQFSFFFAFGPWRGRRSGGDPAAAAYAWEPPPGPPGDPAPPPLVRIPGWRLGGSSSYEPAMSVMDWRLPFVQAGGSGGSPPRNRRSQKNNNNTAGGGHSRPLAVLLFNFKF